ncbi:MAG: acetyl-CoA carboxylase biotin carboxyl carrier protein [Halanaerobiaceae bacterium]
MNLEEIKSLIDILSDSDVSEIELDDGNSKIKIKRGSQTIEYTPVETERQVIAPQHSTQPESKEEEGTDKEEIVAPMVGTFYRAPSPDSDTFVEVGDIVNPGDTLCIIEAMKLMNEIEVETRGKIVKILVDNAQPVEYGQPLFLVEPL